MVVRALRRERVFRGPCNTNQPSFTDVMSRGWAFPWVPFSSRQGWKEWGCGEEKHKKPDSEGDVLFWFLSTEKNYRSIMTSAFNDLPIYTYESAPRPQSAGRTLSNTSPTNYSRRFHDIRPKKALRNSTVEINYGSQYKIAISTSDMNNENVHSMKWLLGEYSLMSQIVFQYWRQLRSSGPITTLI